MAASEVKEFVDESAYLEVITDEEGKERVKCKLTGHQLPCRLPDIISYTNGKKYQRLLKGVTQSEQQVSDSEDYKKYLVPSQKRRNQLYCKVTKKLINNIPHHIEQHLQGKRFQRGLKSYKESLENAANQEESQIWKPSDSESDSVPSELSDNFLDEEGNGENEEELEKEKSDEESDEEMKEVNDDDSDKEDVTPAREAKFNKNGKSLKKKVNHSKDVKQNSVKTRKRKADEQMVSQPKTLTKKCKQRKDSGKQPKKNSKKKERK